MGPGSRFVVAGIVALAFAAPASAAPTWLAPFDLGFNGPAIAMGPDGTTVFYGLANVAPTGFPVFRIAVQVRPPGGPLGAVQYLSAEGTSVSGPAVSAGPDGRVVAVLGGDNILESAVLRPGATSFGENEQLPVPPVPTSMVVGIDGAGNAAVAGVARTSGGGNDTVTLLTTSRPATGPPPVGARIIMQETSPMGDPVSNSAPSLAV